MCRSVRKIGGEVFFKYPMGAWASIQTLKVKNGNERADELRRDKWYGDECSIEYRNWIGDEYADDSQIKW